MFTVLWCQPVYCHHIVCASLAPTVGLTNTAEKKIVPPGRSLFCQDKAGDAAHAVGNALDTGEGALAK